MKTQITQTQGASRVAGVEPRAPSRDRQRRLVLVLALARSGQQLREIILNIMITLPRDRAGNGSVNNKGCRTLTYLIFTAPTRRLGGNRIIGTPSSHWTFLNRINEKHLSLIEDLLAHEFDIKFDMIISNRVLQVCKRIFLISLLQFVYLTEVMEGISFGGGGPMWTRCSNYSVPPENEAVPHCISCSIILLFHIPPGH